jgi:predicted dehydrogenase
MTLSIGLVGLGDAGGHYGRALAELHVLGELRWSGIAARSPASVARFRQAVNVPAGVSDCAGLDGLLDHGCDAVVLATPDGLHAAQVRRCAAAGVHVLCEKPLALAGADARAAAAACKSAKVSLQVGYHLRHHAGHRRLHARAAEWLGPLTNVAVAWAWPDPGVDGWRARADNARYWSLAALGTHGIDLAQWLIGAPISEAGGVTSWRDGVDVAATTALRFESGAHATIWSSVSHRATRRLIVTGERGAIECVDTLGARGAGDMWLRRNREAAERIEFVQVNPYLAQLRAFIAAIAAGAHGGGHDAIANIDTIERAHGCAPRKEPA